MKEPLVLGALLALIVSGCGASSAQPTVTRTPQPTVTRTPQPTITRTPPPSVAPTAPPDASPTATGHVAEVFAGSKPGDGGDGGPATAAKLSKPVNLAVDAEGNVYIAECTGNRVRRVNPAGIIDTVAGGNGSGFGGDGGPATDAQLSCPFALEVDSDGNLYIADIYNHRIRRVDGEGTITTIAGTGGTPDSGDGGPAIDAALNQPAEVRVAPDGALVVASGAYIRRIDGNGIISTIAGLGAPPGSSANVLHWADDQEGKPAVDAAFSDSGGIAFGPNGDMYFADYGDNRVLMIDAAGLIHTVAGTRAGAGDGTGDGGPATAAELRSPADVAFGPDGSLYILEHFGHIRRVAPNGTISTLDIGWQYDEAQGIVADDRFLYIADRDHAVVVRVPF